MSTPSRARTSSADSSSTAWTRRGSLRCSAAERARPLARLDLLEPPHPALGLRHDLVRDHEHVAAARSAGAASASSAPRSSPGRTSGSAREGVEGERLGQAGTARRARRPRAVELAQRSARGGRLAAPAARGPPSARRGRRRCPRRAAAWARGPPRAPRPPPAPPPRAARGCPGPKLGSIASGGLSSSAFVPSPWRSGTITTPSRSSRSAPEQRRELGRVEQRGVARHEQHSVEAACLGVADADHRGRRLARLLGVAQHPHPLAEGGCLRHAVGGHHGHRIERSDAAQRGEHVGEHRLRQRLPRAGPERGGEALLGGAEALHGEDRDRAHRRPGESQRE